MKQSLHTFFLHLIVFLLIEVLFVVVIFRELPETNIFTAIGIGHSIYWIVVIIAAWIREISDTVIKKFIATYLPVVVHLLIHLRVGREIFSTHADDHPEDTWRLVGSVILLGFLIYRGELLLHRKKHCDTHHHKTHKECCKKGHEACAMDHHHQH